MTVETRILALWHHQHQDGELELTQTAIPWCTAHDSKAPNLKGLDCDLKMFTEEGIQCVISLGGPDHKWWKDRQAGPDGVT